jgi:hypothetical protein
MSRLRVTSASISAPAARRIVGRIAVGENIDIGVDVGQHAADDIALALKHLAPDDSACGRGGVGSIRWNCCRRHRYVRPAARAESLRSPRRWLLPRCSRAGSTAMERLRTIALCGNRSPISSRTRSSFDKTVAPDCMDAEVARRTPQRHGVERKHDDEPSGMPLRPAMLRVRKGGPGQRQQRNLVR